MWQFHIAWDPVEHLLLSVGHADLVRGLVRGLAGAARGVVKG